MIFAVLNIFALSPDFQTAVTNMHNTLVPITEVVCVAGFMWLTIQAMRERAIQIMLPALVQITVVALLTFNMAALGNWLSDLTADIAAATPTGTGNVFQLYTAAIKQKFGVDVSGLNQLSPNGPFATNSGSSVPTATQPTISTYGGPNDTTPDGNSSQGIGIGPYDKQGSLNALPLAIALSPNLAAGYTPGQQITVTLTNGQTLTGTYADQTAATFNGQTLTRVDLFDPNDQYSSLAGVGVTNIAAGPAPAADNGNPVQNFFGAMMHPAESMAIMTFGLAVLFLSYVALFILWMVALIQSVLFYGEIALSPLFLGFLMVPGLQDIGKRFLLSFVGICLWPLAFIFTGLITSVLISLALNTSNNVGIGYANGIGGMTYFWLIGTAIWVIVSSIAGPWMISRHFMSGSTGIAAMGILTFGAAANAYRTMFNSASRMVSGGTRGGSNGSAPASPPPPPAVGGLAPNYATRPVSTNQPTP